MSCQDKGSISLEMSSIEKLLIRGIRSFNPDEPAVIEFYSPVTLIVGHNGAGKTTIIECLKYATTGDLPPNSKGGAFVHDPKLLTNESIVKAQVKLKFRNLKGLPMVVTRSIQLSTKNKKSELKTLEGLLVTNDPATGEQISISSRVADLDAEVPLHLGVSRAVLENVIFCHQEESHWPLSEPSVLKKKFDDIFAATRYTKALDILKNLKKQLLSDLKVEQQKLEHCKSDKDKAMRVAASAEVSRNKLAEVVERITALQGHIETCNIRIQQVGEEMRAVNSVHSELDKVSHEFSFLNSSIVELGNSGMRIMSENDERLASLLEQHSQISTKAYGDQSSLQNTKEQLSCSLSALSADETSKQIQLGTAKATLSEHHKRWATFISKFPEEQISRSNISQIQSKLTEESIKSKRIFNQAESFYNEQNNLLNSQKSSLSLKKNSLEESRKHQRRLTDDQRNKLSNILMRQSELSICEGFSIEELQCQIANEEQIINKISIELQQPNYEQRLSELQREKKNCEEESISLNFRLAEASKSLDARVKLDLRREELIKKSEMLSKLMKELENESKSHEIIYGGEDAEQFEKMVDLVWHAKEKLLKTLIERQENSSQLRGISQSKVAHLKSMLLRKQEELIGKQRKLVKVVGEDCRNFPLALEEAEEELQAFYSQQGTNNASIATFEGFLERTQKDHNCPLCERGFPSRVEAESFSLKLKKMIKEMSNLRVSSDNRSELENRLQGLRVLRPVFDDLNRLQSVEIPEIVRELADAEDEAGKSALNFDELSSEQSQVLLEEKRLSIFRKKAEEASRLSKELKMLQSNANKMENELRITSGNGALLSLDEIQIRMSDNQQRKQVIQAEIDAVNQEIRSRQDDLGLHQTRFRDLKEQVLQVQMAKSEETSLSAQKVECETELERLSKEIQIIDREISFQNDQLTKLDSEIQTKLIDLKQRLDAARSETIQTENRLMQFEMESRSFVSNPLEEVDLNSRITEVEGQIGLIALEIKNKTNEMNHICDQLDAYNKRTSDLEMTTRQIRDNQRLREMIKKRENIEAKVTDLQAQASKTQKNELLGQLQKLQFKYSDLLGERSGLLGESRQLEDQINSYERELTEDYPEAEETYLRQYIKCETAAMASDDIEKYSRALDSAIMRYHSAKMDEINRIIRELWTSTYQGADIDTVEIRADAETTAANRSYNYRVVMLKGGDRELDMRGRSSAGQRVLASLIIRLALAETFGLQCGVLALDEPTTNLDRENIEGLASALGELVRVRRAQSNFQLLIITHDEEFVAMLGRHQCADYYWRIDKDENQNSIIERQSIQTF